MSKPILFKSDEIVPLLRRGMPIGQIASSLKPTLSSKFLD